MHDRLGWAERRAPWPTTISCNRARVRATLSLRSTVAPSIVLRRGEQLQLIGIADGGAKKDVVALAALKALHCVDSDVLTAREVAGSQATAHGGNLTAEGNNHTDLGGWIERQAAACIQAIKRFNQSRYHFGLGGIDFVVFGRQSRHDVDKAQTRRCHGAHQGVIRRGKRQGPVLVGQGHRT